MGSSGDMQSCQSPKSLDIPQPSISPSDGSSGFAAPEETLDFTSKASSVRGSSSTFGVESLEETGDDASAWDVNGKGGGEIYVSDGREGRRRSTLKPGVFASHRDGSLNSTEQVLNQTQACHEMGGEPSHLVYRHASPMSTSESLASVSQISHLHGLSLTSSPKSTSTRSFRPSDDESTDEVASQAIASSGDEENEPSSEVLDSSPQLIMPSIKMPSRRPFTEKGKGMGLLKILIAGDSGVGKTSLIKSIVQACEDIVHVDPLTPNFPSIDQLRPRKVMRSREKVNVNSTDQVTEVYASTRPYPAWWTEFEESRMLRRRKSMGDTVLERNLCFVDTPGYSRTGPATDGIESVVRYVEAQIDKTSSCSNASYGELMNLLSGRGGTQVDLALYMIYNEIKPADLDFMKRLSAFTNVIPLIAKSDLLSSEAARALKQSIRDELNAAGIRPFDITPDETMTSPPYTVCSVSAGDAENMDASLLMSPDYVQPLISSELSYLVHRVFHGETIRCMRHLAARKIVDFRRSVSLSVPPQYSRSPSRLHPSQSQFLVQSGSSFSSSSLSRAMISHRNPGNSYFQAMTADHTQREERFAQIRLAKWAGDLQRCLHNERSRYEALARGERAVWLTERLGECVKDGSLVPVNDAPTVKSPQRDDNTAKPGMRRHSTFNRVLNPRDPLGLVRWNDLLKRRGWIAVQVVGGFGVLGAMAVWMARSWGAGADAYSNWSCAFWDGNCRSLANP